jgi:putative spermidine/putrescine transport system substrate-binding protein
LEPIDTSSANYTNLKNLYPGMVHEHWIVSNFAPVGLTYNRSIKAPPTSWADLWRPEFKGRIVLPDITHSAGTYIVPVGALASGKDPRDLKA